MSTKQAALRLNVDQKTINRWAKDGTLASASRLNGDTGPWMFDPADVEALAVERRAALAAKLDAMSGGAA